MKDRKYNGDLSVCNKVDLMCDGEFMNRSMIKESCTKCIYQALCLSAEDLIRNGKHEEALFVLENRGEQ